MMMTPYGISHLTTRPAWVAMWWSVLLPGFGHFYLGANTKAFILVSWEMAVNYLAHLNLAIYHSILGEPHRAAQVLDLRWAFIYPSIYLFAIFDSYRLAVEYSKVSQLEALQIVRTFQRAQLHPVFGINALDKRNPLVAAVFALFVGGLGHLYNLKAIKALMLTAWQLTVVVLSNGHTAAILTLQGQFAQAAAVVDYQWLLFWPSIQIFNVIDAYSDCVELNRLYDVQWEYRLRRYLRNPSWPQRPAPLLPGRQRREG